LEYTDDYADVYNFGMEYLFMDNLEMANRVLSNVWKKTLMINLHYTMWSIVLNFRSKFRSYCLFEPSIKPIQRNSLASGGRLYYGVKIMKMPSVPLITLLIDDEFLGAFMEKQKLLSD
jgi:hypothetical protein